MAVLQTSLQFVIASDFCESLRVQRRILEEVHRRHFDSDAEFAIKLSLEEAMSNAIKHGNRCCQDKMIRVEASVSEQQAEITIEDEGEGFVRRNVPDPTADENLERLHGRGILLMEAYMDEVQWDCGGRRVRMVRKNRPGEQLP